MLHAPRSAAQDAVHAAAGQPQRRARFEFDPLLDLAAVVADPF